MTNIDRYQKNTPELFKLDLIKTFFHDSLSSDEIELTITIEQTNLNVKEFSSYLELIYRLDGYLSEVGLSKYSHNPSKQIEITEVKFGSISLVFKQILDSIDAERIVLFPSFRSFES